MLHGSDGRTRCSDDVLYTVRICPVRNFGTHFQSGDFKMEDQKILHPSYSYSSPSNIQKKPKKALLKKSWRHKQEIWPRSDADGRDGPGFRGQSASSAVAARLDCVSDLIVGSNHCNAFKERKLEIGHAAFSELQFTFLSFIFFMNNLPRSSDNKEERI